MKVIILAAGIGSRLDQKENHLPKALTDINGKSILERQIDSLSLHFSLDDIFLVVGYKKESIMERFPELAYVYNPSFADENTSKSLLRALNKVSEDVLWINGDVLFHPSVVERILKFNKTAMIVNRSKVGEEEVKYRANNEGKILKISKKVSSPQGEALGLNLFKRKDLPMLKKQLEKCKPSDYFERGIEMCIQAGMDVWAVQVGLQDCVEIDFPEDLKKAKNILKAW